MSAKPARGLPNHCGCLDRFDTLASLGGPVAGVDTGRQASHNRFSGGSMRIGNRLVGRVAGAIVAVLTATSAPRAVADEQVQPVPLGGSLTGQKGDRYFGVYVPTRFGGVLTIKSTSGKVQAIKGPDGRERRNGEEVGTDKHGWYTFKVSEPEKDKSYAV